MSVMYPRAQWLYKQGCKFLFKIITWNSHQLIKNLDILQTQLKVPESPLYKGRHTAKGSQHIGSS